LFAYTDEVDAVFTVNIIGFPHLQFFAYATCLVNSITY